MVHLPPDAPSPRLCVLEKTTPSQEYGYNLHAEKTRGQFVGVVDKSSPAEIGGLRAGDKIYAVNGVSIIGEPHKKVVQRIKEDPMRCEMLVISEDGAQWYKEHDITIDMSLPNIVRGNAKETADPVFVAPPPPPQEESHDMTTQPLPRLCKLEKTSPSDEFGFNLHAEKGRGHFIGTVDGNGIGDRAGLRMGQRIVGVNGELVFPTTPHRDVVAQIKKYPLSTTLLVASEEVDKWYKDHAESYSFDRVEHYPQQISPHSIQISDEEDYHHSPAPKVEETPAPPVINVEVASQRHNSELEHHAVGIGAGVAVSQHYDEPPADHAAEIPLDDIFGAMPVLAPAEEIEHQELEHHPINHQDVFVDDRESLAPSEHPSQVEHHHHYHEEPHVEVAPPVKDDFMSHVYEHNRDHDQMSPVSNGSSSYHVSNGSVSPSEEMDIFRLSAKEARERLRQQKKNIHRGFDMTLEQKYQIVTNM